MLSCWKNLFDENLNKNLKKLDGCIENQSKFNQLVANLIEDLNFEDSDSKEKEEEIENSKENSTAPEKNRDDDNEEVIITRYYEYIKKTKPVLDFYSSRSYFHELDGSQKIQAITNKIVQILTV